MPPKLKSHNFLKNDWTIGQLINTLCANEISRGWRFRSVSQGYPILQQPPYNRDVVMGTMASQITGLTIVYSTVYSGAHQGKHQSSASLAFVQGSHRRPKNFPHKWPVTWKMLPLDDVIMQLCRYAGRLPTQSPVMRSLCRCHKFIMPDDAHLWDKKKKKCDPWWTNGQNPAVEIDVPQTNVTKGKIYHNITTDVWISHPPNLALTYMTRHNIPLY